MLISAELAGLGLYSSWSSVGLLKLRLFGGEYPAHCEEEGDADAWDMTRGWNEVATERRLLLLPIFSAPVGSAELFLMRRF